MHQWFAYVSSSAKQLCRIHSLALHVRSHCRPDATLRELVDLVKEVFEPARPRGARVSLAVVYPDRNGRNVLRRLGITGSRPTNSADEHRTLASVGFQPGDFLDVCVL